MKDLFAFSVSESPSEAPLVSVTPEGTYDPGQQVWIDENGFRKHDKLSAEGFTMCTTGTGNQYAPDTDSGECDFTPTTNWLGLPTDS